MSGQCRFCRIERPHGEDTSVELTDASANARCSVEPSAELVTELWLRETCAEPQSEVKREIPGTR